MCLRFVRHFDDFLLYSFIFLIPTEPPPRHVKCAACEPGPSHLQLFLYFSHINCTISLTPLLIHTTPHALGSSPSSLSFALLASIAEVKCLLARLASFKPVRARLLSPKPDVPSLVLNAHPASPACLSPPVPGSLFPFPHAGLVSCSLPLTLYCRSD